MMKNNTILEFKESQELHMAWEMRECYLENLLKKTGKTGCPFNIS